MYNCTFQIINMLPRFTNSVLLSCGNECVIFDAWGSVEDWIKRLSQSNLIPVAIYSTHGHYDHISAAPALVRHYNIPWYLNTKDENITTTDLDIGLPCLSEQDKLFTNIPSTKIHLFNNDVIMTVFETPGHTPGGVCFYFSKNDVLLTGDTIFDTSCGRCDLYGGDWFVLQQSIKKLYELDLPDKTLIIPGHGNTTNVSKLKKYNQFFTA